MSLEDSEIDPEADEGLTSEEPSDETVAYGETDEWGGNDLEAAYRKALEANDDVEWEFDHLAPVEEAAEDGDSTEGSANESAVEPGEDSDSTSLPDNKPDPIPQRVTARQVIEAAIFVGLRKFATC